MQKRSLFSILLLLIVGLVPASLSWAGPEHSMTVQVTAGSTEFEIQGEAFRVATPQALTIVFEGVTPDRVWGKIFVEGDTVLGDIDFIWLRGGIHQTYLHQGGSTTREIPFDSEEVTGHNEK